MAKLNQVCANFQQDFTDVEKAQARANIGAGTGNGGSNIMFSNVLGGADNSLANAQISHNRQNLPSTFDYYDMSVTNENSNTKSFALLPTDMSDGMVVMSNGHAVTRTIPDCNLYIASDYPQTDDEFEKWKTALTSNKMVVLSQNVNGPIYQSFTSLSYRQVDASTEEIITEIMSPYYANNVNVGIIFKFTRVGGVVTQTSNYVRTGAPTIRSNVAFTRGTPSGSTVDWTSPTIHSPDDTQWSMLSYSIYVDGILPTEEWGVKNNGSNWTTGIYGNFSTYICMIPPSQGVTFTVTTPTTVDGVRFSYMIHQYYV